MMPLTQRAPDVCAHLGDDYDAYHGAIVPPLFQNTLFTRKRADPGYRYTRVNNPTVELLEQKLAALEHAEAARVFSSGMGAITAVLCSLLRSGDHVLLLRTAYHPVCDFLQGEMARFGVECDLADDFSRGELDRLVKPNTRVFYLESPSSNVFKILDLRAIAAYAGERGITTVLDNTWATPLYQNPLDLGIDYVVHSCTKYLGGHSDVVAGAAMGSAGQMERLRHRERAEWGACIDPFAAWLLLRSLRTLEVRMQRHSATGGQIAAFLEAHPKVRKVYYPGLPSHEGYALAQTQLRGCTGLLSFVLDADEDASMRFLKRLRVFEEGPSWGGFESIINSPGITVPPAERAEQGLPDGLLRISAGLEAPETLLEDLDQSLKQL